jgi:hypothetical protein
LKLLRNIQTIIKIVKFHFQLHLFFLLAFFTFQMGNNICCDEKEHIQSKRKISAINKKNSDSKRISLFFDANSTSDDEEEVKTPSVARTQAKKI